MMRFLLLTALLATAPLAEAQRIPVTTVSDDARLHYVRGETALFNGEGTRARAHFDAAIAADPTFAMAHAYRAASALDAEARDEHLRLAQQHSAHITDAERQWVAGILAGTGGDTEAQVEILRTLADAVPDDPRPMFILTYAETNLGNPAAAVAAGVRARAADPSYAPLYNALGYAEMAAGDMDAAEAAFREQLRLAPGHANPYDSYGDFFMANDRLDEAEAQFQLALTHNPNFQGSRNKLIRIAVMRAAEAHLAAYNRNDADDFAATFTEDAVVSPPGMPQVIGREAILETVSELFSSGRWVGESETQEIDPLGEGSVYHRTSDTERLNGETEHRSIGTMIWVETPDGWKVSRYTWAPAPSTP